MARNRDEDYTDRPRRRREDEDEEDQPPPRRSRRYDEEEEDDPPVRRRYEEDEEEEDYDPRPRRRPLRPRRAQLTGMDSFFTSTNIVVLVLFSCFCSGLAVILGIVGLATCKDERAKSNALIVTIIGAIVAVGSFIARLAAALSSR